MALTFYVYSGRSHDSLPDLCALHGGPVLSALQKMKKGTCPPRLSGPSTVGTEAPILITCPKTCEVCLNYGPDAFGISLFIFSRLGGEFLPTLDEGDYVIQPRY